MHVLAAVVHTPECPAAAACAGVSQEVQAARLGRDQQLEEISPLSHSGAPEEQLSKPKE
jgi:hypothetical protein